MGLLRDPQANKFVLGRSPGERIMELPGRQANMLSVVAVVLVALWTCFLAAPSSMRKHRHTMRLCGAEWMTPSRTLFPGPR